jgi:hypothetical protein
MPSKRKKPKSKQTKSKSRTSRLAKKTSREQQARKKKKQQSSKKKISSKTSPALKRKAPRRRAQGLKSLGTKGAVSSLQSGDLEGLSRVEQADSESVDELVEEGNISEAGAVAGVEEADDQDTREVHTHEVPEDDVPDEYLDKD